MVILVILFLKFCKVCGKVNDFSTKSTFQDGCQRFQENVNLPSKKAVNCIRKKVKNCQPKSGKDSILKTEVIYRERRFKSLQDARERIASFIGFYNEKRPHASIGMKVPSKVHTENGKQLRMW